MTKLLKLLLVPVVGFAAIFVGANVVVERMAEDRISVAIARELELTDTPKVEIGGFPVLLDVLVRRRLESISITANDMTIEGLRVGDATVELRDLTSSDFLAGRVGVKVGSGSARARVTDDAVNRYLSERKAGVAMTFEPGRAVARASRVYAGRRRNIVATGRIEIRRGMLVFVPGDITIDGRPAPGSMRERARRDVAVGIRIPQLPGGIRPTAVEVEEGAVVLTAKLDETELTLG